MISGVLYSRNGDNLTSLYTDLYVPSADLNALWTRLEHARFVVSGAQQEPKSVIYVIMDPNCIYCHFLWLALKAYEAAGLQVRWVPVGFLHADSVPKAAALLTRGAGALQGLEENFDEKTESGAIEPIEVTAEMKEALVANQQIMRDSTMSGTPGIFYKDAEGHVRRKQGMPELYELPGITGLPVQPQTDPRLDRFNK
jgi:thiol:disulfide interchange protein DsbG